MRGAKNSISLLAEGNLRDYTGLMVWCLAVAGVLVVVALVLVFTTPKPRLAAPDLSEVRRLAETGRLNDAARVYRRLTGVEQAEADIAIDRIVRGHPPVTPPAA